MGADTAITLSLRPQAAMLVDVTVSTARVGERAGPSAERNH